MRARSSAQLTSRGSQFLDHRRAFAGVFSSFVYMLLGVNSPSHMPRRLRWYMSGGGRAWQQGLIKDIKAKMAFILTALAALL
jgi:hypothetical protein